MTYWTRLAKCDISSQFQCALSNWHTFDKSAAKRLISGSCLGLWLVVVEVNEHNQYHVKMYGYGRVSRRNEQFLKRIVLVSSLVVRRSITGPGVVDDRVTCGVE